MDQSWKYRWRLLAANGRIVADSGQGYVSKEGAKEDVAWLKTYVAGASVEE